jgi:hypothetical protein
MSGLTVKRGPAQFVEKALRLQCTCVRAWEEGRGRAHLRAVLQEKQWMQLGRQLGKHVMEQAIRLVDRQI